MIAKSKRNQICVDSPFKLSLIRTHWLLPPRTPHSRHFHLHLRSACCTSFRSSPLSRCISLLNFSPAAITILHCPPPSLTFPPPFHQNLTQKLTISPIHSFRWIASHLPQNPFIFYCPQLFRMLAKAGTFFCHFILWIYLPLQFELLAASETWIFWMQSTTVFCLLKWKSFLSDLLHFILPNDLLIRSRFWSFFPL